MSIYFDASGDYIKQVNAYNVVDAASASFFCRYKWSVAPTTYQELMRVYEDTGGTAHWNIAWSYASTRFDVTLNASTRQYISTAGWDLTQWIDIAFSINGTSATFYAKPHSEAAWTSVAVTASDDNFYNDGWMFIPNISTSQPMNICHLRMWTTNLSSAELLSEAGSATLVKQTSVLFNCPFPSAGSYNDTSQGSYTANGYNFTAVGSPTTGDADPTFTALYLKLLAHSSAASATGVEGWVVDADNTTYYGKFTGEQFDAGTGDDEGFAVLKVALSEFGGTALTTSDTPQVVVRNTGFGTTMCDAEVVEE